MKRKEQRLLKKLEIEPVKGLINTQKHFYAGLQKRLNEVKDPRDKRYTIYNSSTLLGTGITKNICGIPTMRQMTAAFNDEDCIRNISDFVDNKNGELPHYVTLNEFLKKLDPSELQKVRKDILYHLIRMKTFDNARFQKKWLVIVDATWLQTYGEYQDDFCMCREYKREDGTKKHLWYRMALEAKIVLGDDLIVSFDTEFIENNGKDAERQKKMSADEIKQDCETKAFKRLAARIKKDFPRLPILLLGDSLYAGEPVFDLCRENKWNYIIRYKEGSIPSIMKEYDAILEKGRGKRGKTEHANSHDWNALKNHYLITQIADIFRQLYVHRELKKIGLKRTEKNISSELLASFGRQLTKEDILKNDAHSVAVN